MDENEEGVDEGATRGRRGGDEESDAKYNAKYDAKSNEESDDCDYGGKALCPKDRARFGTLLLNFSATAYSIL